MLSIWRLFWIHLVLMVLNLQDCQFLYQHSRTSIMRRISSLFNMQIISTVFANRLSIICLRFKNITEFKLPRGNVGGMKKSFSGVFTFSIRIKKIITQPRQPGNKKSLEVWLFRAGALIKLLLFKASDVVRHNHLLKRWTSFEIKEIIHRMLSKYVFRVLN